MDGKKSFMGTIPGLEALVGDGSKALITPHNVQIFKEYHCKASISIEIRRSNII